MKDKKAYIQIKDCDTGPTLTLSVEEAKTFIDEIAGNSDGDPYTFCAVEMAEDEFKNLPEFLGF